MISENAFEIVFPSLVYVDRSCSSPPNVRQNKERF